MLLLHNTLRLQKLTNVQTQNAGLQESRKAGHNGRSRFYETLDYGKKFFARIKRKTQYPRNRVT